MYNNKSLFIDNPINRYKIGQYTEGLKNNTDGSLDVYVQNANPGKDRVKLATSSYSSCIRYIQAYSAYVSATITDS
jgi:hypothetical protein